MARVIHGPIIADAQGLAGDVVFAHLLGTTYVRARQKQYYSNSPAQQAYRTPFSRFTKAYSSLGFQFRNQGRGICNHHERMFHAVFQSAFMRQHLASGPVPFILPNGGLPQPETETIARVANSPTFDLGINNTPYLLEVMFGILDSADRLQTTALGFFPTQHMQAGPGFLITTDWPVIAYLWVYTIEFSFGLPTPPYAYWQGIATPLA